MNIIAVDHITINVCDLKKTEEFYENVLGLLRAGFIDMGDHSLTYYKLGLSTRLELINYLDDSNDFAILNNTTKGIYRHFCIETDNLDEVYAICKKNNVEIRKEPSFVESLGVFTMLIADPNKVEIEIIKR